MMTDTKIKQKGKYLKKSPKKTGKHLKFRPGLILVLTICVLLAGIGGMLLLLRDQSVYDTIARDGYTGTQEQWLASLVGEQADPHSPQTAYKLAVANGYTQSEEVWIQTLTGSDGQTGEGTPYEIACASGYEGTLVQWLTALADKPDQLGISRGKEKKTEYELACEYGFSGTFIEWLVSVSHDRVFE